MMIAECLLLISSLKRFPILIWYIYLIGLPYQQRWPTLFWKFLISVFLFFNLGTSGNYCKSWNKRIDKNFIESVIWKFGLDFLDRTTRKDTEFHENRWHWLSNNVVLLSPEKLIQLLVISPVLFLFNIFNRNFLCSF